MKTSILLKIILFTSIITACISVAFSQTDPLNSPYFTNGPENVIIDSIMTSTPEDVLIFRPDNSNNGPYPTVLFQPGANSGTEYINKHSYDLYWEHLASYGFVIIIINNTEGGPNGTLFSETHDWIKDSVADINHWMHSYIDLSKFIVSGHSNGGMNATDIIIDRPDEINAILYLASYPNPGMFGLGAQNVSGYTGKAFFICGSEDDTSVPMLGSTNDIAQEAYNTRFTSAECKTWVMVDGAGHGAFGDYNNPDQPVGTIGRDSATASIRHYITSFLLSEFKSDSYANDQMINPDNQPGTISEFLCTCIANDIGIVSINSPGTSCQLSSQEYISVEIENYGSMSQNNFNISYQLDGGTVITENYTGSIPGGGVSSFTFSTPADLSTPGNYEILAFTQLQGDSDSSNDSITVDVENLNSTVNLPIFVDFTGFTGDNLTDIYPDWMEAENSTPTGISSAWTSRTGLGDASNITCKINFYSYPVSDWIIGPAFTASNTSILTFNAAITSYNTFDEYLNGMDATDKVYVMISSDCGFTWTQDTVLDMNTNLTNALQEISVPLNEYAGNTISVAFYAERNSSSSYDYDFHIDNINIKNTFSTDLALLEIQSPTQFEECYSNNENVSVDIMNTGMYPIDFTSDPATLMFVSNETNPDTLYANIDTGILAIGDSLLVEFQETFDMSDPGYYSFEVSLIMNADGDSLNNITNITSFQVIGPEVGITGNQTICEGESVWLYSNVSYNGGSETETYSNTTEYGIPDNSTTGVMSPITVAQSTSLASNLISVEVNIEHTYVGDLTLDLIAPNGSSILLSMENGGTGDGYTGTIFTQTASEYISSGSAPFSGEYLPEGSFGSLTGSAEGTWNLKVTDGANYDTGSILNWSLTLENTPEVNFEWSTGETSDSIIVSPASNETITLTATDPCGISVTDSLEIIVQSAESISIGNDTAICAGNQISITAESGFSSYLWSTGETTEEITVQNAGTYWIEAETACGNISDTLVVIENQLPFVFLGNDTLICDNETITLDAGDYESYEWSNGNTDQQTTIDGSALGIGTYEYTVEVTDQNMCSNADTIIISVDLCSKINDFNTTQANIYPNPAKNILFIDFPETVTNVEITLWTITGKKVLSEKIMNTKTQKLNISSLQKGMYIIQIKSSKYNTTLPVIIEQ
ncbi:MAG: hypothetical protein C0594_15050 [Marinilabiliales bacterium]|nr:MAG: hypothetical protein C0594_15050 [Marinilabiliales bacterium]